MNFKEMTEADKLALYVEFEEVYNGVFMSKFDSQRFVRHSDSNGVAAYIDRRFPDSQAESIISSAFIFFTIGKGYKNF